MTVEQSKQSAVLQVVPWGLALASIFVLGIGKRGLYGTGLFIIMAVVVALAMQHALRKVNIFVAVPIIFFGEAGLFLAAFLLRFAPYMGYLGQVMSVLQPLLLVTTLLSMPLLLWGPKCRLGRLGFSELVVLAQIVLLAAQVGVYGTARFLPGWQARGLETKIVTISNWGGSTCQPLVEGSTAFLAQNHGQKGAFYQVDLASGLVVRQIDLPEITPEQLGHPNWQNGGASLQPRRGVITRQDSDTLVFQYPTRFIADGDWVSVPVSIKLTIDLTEGAVSKWEKCEGEDAQAGFVPNEEPYQELSSSVGQVGAYSVFWQGTQLHFRSPERHYLLRLGRPAWLRVLDDGTLLMDQGGGRLYIVRLREGR